MNNDQYKKFLDDPADFLNGGVVKKLRINISPSGNQFKNTVERTATYPGSVPINYQYSDSLVTKVYLRYDTTALPETNRALWAETTDNGNNVSDRAYWLKWSADQAWAITLGYEAQLFFTATLTGCGILVLESPKGLTVVHHNVQVGDIEQTFMEKVFESRSAYESRSAENRFSVRTQTLGEMARHIVEENDSITTGSQLDVNAYLKGGNPAHVFGVKRSDKWRIFVNHDNKGTGYNTELLHAQS